MSRLPHPEEIACEKPVGVLHHLRAGIDDHTRVRSTAESRLKRQRPGSGYGRPCASRACHSASSYSRERVRKRSPVGRSSENHKMMLDHYQQTKNLLVSYSPNKLGFF